MKGIHIFNHPIRFIKLQLEREFFGFIGLISSIGILTYGVIYKGEVTLSTFSTVQGNHFTVPITILGFILIFLFGVYLVIKNRRT